MDLAGQDRSFRSSGEHDNGRGRESKIVVTIFNFQLIIPTCRGGGKFPEWRQGRADGAGLDGGAASGPAPQLGGTERGRETSSPNCPETAITASRPGSCVAVAAPRVQAWRRTRAQGRRWRGQCGACFGTLSNGDLTTSKQAVAEYAGMPCSRGTAAVGAARCLRREEEC
jgi:hypothetical protein